MAIYFINQPVDQRVLSRFRTLNRITGEGKSVVSLKRLKTYKNIDGIIFNEDSDRNLLNEFRDSGIPCMFASRDSLRLNNYIESLNIKTKLKAERFNENGYEVTTKGDSRFSPFVARIYGTSIENYYQLDIKGLRSVGAKSWRDCKGLGPLIIEIASSIWTRGSVKFDKDSLYIFTDNLLRTSGRNPIGESNWYTEQYGYGNYPNVSQAVIRGLSNAYPITTMADYQRTQLSDKDYRKILINWNQEISDIKMAYRSGKYKRIVIANTIFGCGTFSQMKEFAPKCFTKLCELLKTIGIDNYGTQITSDYPARDIYKEYYQCYEKWLSDNPEMIIELLELTREHSTLTDMFWTTGLSQAKVLADILNTYILAG